MEGRRGTNLPRLADFNQAVILDAVRHAPDGLSRVELAGLTGLSAQAVSNITRRLLDRELIAEAGTLVPAGRGKPRTLLRLHPTGHYAIGVHVDPTVTTLCSTSSATSWRRFARCPRRRRRPPSWSPRSPRPPPRW
jgi:hypothetical protein